MKEESIKIFWRIGYIRLIDEGSDDLPYTSPREVTFEDGEWRRLFWRIYWRVG